METATVYSSFVFSKVVSCTFILSCITFQMDLVGYPFWKKTWINNLFFYLSMPIVFLLSQQLQGLDYNLCLLVMAIVSNVTTISVYCYFGKMATESFLDMSCCLFESDWLHLPVKLQRFFILMIADAQLPLHYHGFHIATLNLETFTKVTKKFKILINSLLNSEFVSF